MGTLIVNQNPLGQWRLLIEEASQLSSISLNEDLENYLIWLLMRFTKSPEVLNSLIALDFLENIHKSSKENQRALREIGDKCLLFSGLFPKHAAKRRVRISYYVKLGQSAYCSLSEAPKNQLASLYSQLDLNFVRLMDVLQTIRELDGQSNTIDLLEAEALWTDTKSEHALKILKRSTKGFLLPIDSISLQKH